MNKSTAGLIIVGVLIGLGIYFYNTKQNTVSEQTIPVLTREGFPGQDEYYLYVPGSKSDCTWSYLNNGKPESWSAHHETSDQYIFNSNPMISNVQVTCLNDQGVKFKGVFSN